MLDTVSLSGLMVNEQYNLTEMARAMANRRGIPYKEAHDFLNELFTEEIPQTLKSGKPIIIHGFGTFYKHEDQEFNNPATEDKTDRVLKTKVHFRPADLLDIRADKDTI